MQDSLPYPDSSLIGVQNVAGPDTGTWMSDSVMTSFTPEPIPAESLLQNLELINSGLEPMVRSFGNEDWIVVHLLFGMILLAWVNIFFNKRLRQVLKSFFSIRYQYMMIRDGNLFKERISIVLFLIYLISFSLLLYLVLTRILIIDALPYQGFKLFSLVILFVLSIWIVKNLMITFIGHTFKNSLLLNEYLLSNFVLNINFGIYLLPLVIIGAYYPSENMIFAGIYFWLIVFIYRVFRQLFTGLNYRKFSLFNRILYLCTFEFAPLFVLIKLVMNSLN